MTGRLDTTETFRPRNQTITPDGAARVLRGQAPRRHARARPDLRASQPTGPLIVEQSRHHRPRATMPLDQARGVALEFGKFHGHTLGEVADFEPSYIDWLASTVTRDPDLTAAARAIRDELDRRGVVRPLATAAARLALEPIPLSGQANAPGPIPAGGVGRALMKVDPDECLPLSCPGPAGRCPVVTRLVARIGIPRAP